MTKTRIILFVIAAVLIVGIYSLPRVVVENETAEEITVSEKLEPEGPHVAEMGSIPDSLQKEINSLKYSLANSGDEEKSIIFADSLARAYKRAFLFDSAALLLAKFAEEELSEERLQQAGDAYFDAFNFAVSKEKQEKLGEKARSYYERVLEINPANSDAKANLALTYVTTASPMKGIAMLREILEEEPTHEKALFNLGLLSITSGQIDKAVERFSALLESHPENHEARMYLGYTLMETGRADAAKNEFKKVIASDADPAIKTAAERYLEAMN